MGGGDDAWFDALVEHSSLGAAGARRLRERTSLAEADTARRIADLHERAAHGSGEEATEAARSLVRLLRTLGYEEQAREAGEVLAALTAAGAEPVSPPSSPGNIASALVGRGDDLARVRRLLGHARQGRSGALVVEGAAGIGKTAMLDAAVANAPDFQVLRARGLESESSLPFAGLDDLFRSTAGSWDLLPAPQAEALRGALALGATTEADRLVCAAGVLSLLGVLAGRQATLVVVDDAQWLDEQTLETVLFAAHRLEADRAAVLLAYLPGPSRPEGISDLPALRLRRLDAEETAQLVHARYGLVPAPSAAMWLHALTGGNPLAILELTATLAPGQVTGVDALPTRTVAYPGRPHSSLPLTDREFRIASAAAGDATNRQIALDLGISSTAVETYLARIYWKVGVRNRTQLADVLHGGRPEPEARKRQAPGRRQRHPHSDRSS